MNSSQTTDLTVAAVLGVLVIGSAVPTTAKPAMYIAGFLAFLAWVSAFQNGTLQATAKLIIS